MLNGDGVRMKKRGDIPKLTERHVQAVWYDVAHRPRNLRTSSGSEVNVVDPGEWNLAEGPDFCNAVIEVGASKKRLVGDVEVHICPADWDFHKHGGDPNYRNVIAHVTWRSGDPPKSLPRDAVSIWLGRFMTDSSFSPDSVDLAAYPQAKLPLEERPCEKNIGHDPEKAGMVLRAAGDHRLKMKSRRLSGILCAKSQAGIEGRHQLFYEEIMSSFGFGRNSVQFRNVARRVPLSSLPRDPVVAKTALLAAGSFECWNRIGIRPNNQPERRLANAAELIANTPLMEYVDATDFSREGCRKMVGEMCRGHYLGKGRAAAILANIIVPFALAEARMKEIPEWMPAEDVSSPVRITARRLFGRDHNPASCYAGNGLFIQGLIQIRRDCCLNFHPFCEQCCLACE